MKINKVVVDPSAASFIAELKKRGFRVKKAKNDVEDGIRVVGNYLNIGVIYFYESCEMTIKEFNTYAWDSKSASSGNDKPIKEKDHCMDAVRYFIYTILHKNVGYNSIEGGI